MSDAERLDSALEKFNRQLVSLVDVLANANTVRSDRAEEMLVWVQEVGLVAARVYNASCSVRRAAAPGTGIVPDVSNIKFDPEPS